MNSLLSTTDLIIFFGSLLAVMGMGLWVGRKEDSSEDYFLADEVRAGGELQAQSSDPMYQPIILLA